MKGYDRQKRHYSLDIFSFRVHKNLPDDTMPDSDPYDLASELADFDSFPYISMIKIIIQYPEQDEPNVRVN